MEPDPRLLSLARPLDLVALGLALLPDPMHLKSRFIFFFIFEKKKFIDLLRSTNQYASIIYVYCVATKSLFPTLRSWSHYHIFTLVDPICCCLNIFFKYHLEFFWINKLYFYQSSRLSSDSSNWLGHINWTPIFLLIFEIWII
jgi:hypothetical protein